MTAPPVNASRIRPFAASDLDAATGVLDPRPAQG